MSAERVDCRILPGEKADGPRNMANDEALLDYAVEARDQAFFRTYEWSVPTLSLGYFQSIKDAEAEERWQGKPIVRRPTGGGALWHDRELTYALILPKSHPLSARASGLYQTVHEAIIGVLADRGIMSRRRGGVDFDQHDRSKPFLCFRDRDPNDVVLDDHKIVGSAQRRRAGAVLLHGSLLIERSSVTPELPGIADLSGRAESIVDWRALIETEAPKRLGFNPRREPWPTLVIERAQRLAEGVYRGDAWNRRR